MAVFADAEPRRVLEQQLSHALPEQIYGAFDPALGTSDSTDRSADDESVETPNPSSDVIEASMPLLMPWTCAGLHYGDLANQQILVTLLTDGKDRPTVRHKQRLALGQRGCAEQLSWQLFTATQDEKIHQLCNERFVQRLNSRRRQVQELERDLISMLQARCAEPLVDSEIEGQISGVQSYGFFVEVGPMAVEGLVHVSSLNDDWYEYRSRQNRLVGRKNRRSYQLGDKVHVRVIKVDVLRNQIDLEVIPDPLPVEPEEPSTQEPLPVTLDG
jgi:ribonuclease R